MKLIKEHVYTNIFDKHIAKNITASPIWNTCYHKSEVESKDCKYIYTIAFDGLKPVRVDKISFMKQ